MAVLALARVLCILLVPAVWAQQLATSILEVRAAGEPEGTDHTGDILSFTAMEPAYGCYTLPRYPSGSKIVVTNVDWQTPDGVTIVRTGANPIGNEIITGGIVGPTPGVLIARGTDYFSPDGDYCCVMSIDGTETARRCVTFTACPTLARRTDPNERITYNASTHVATYGCNTGYVATITSGDRQRMCQSDGSSVGTWTGTPTAVTCNLLDCGALTDPTNGAVNTSSGTTFMNTATYTCDPGYILLGPSTRTCESTGDWNSTTPTCEAANHGPPSTCNNTNGAVKPQSGTPSYTCANGTNITEHVPALVLGGLLAIAVVTIILFITAFIIRKCRRQSRQTRYEQCPCTSQGPIYEDLTIYDNITGAPQEPVYENTNTNEDISTTIDMRECQAYTPSDTHTS